jgi:hypothetical protein
VQYELDVEYAVGRLWFDSIDDYAHYARSVVLSEEETFTVPPRATVFAPRLRRDIALQVAGRDFVDPLVFRLLDNPGLWSIDQRVGPRATRVALSDLLFKQSTALLFSVSHTLPVGRGNAPNGGLVCADWPGTGAVVQRSHVFTPEDVPVDASLTGTVLILLGNSTAGQSMRTQAASITQPTTQEALVAPLARRLLSLPQGGALAVLGHVDELWSYSFRFELEYEYARYEKLVRHLLDGRTVGLAADLLGQRYSQLRARLDEGLRASFLAGRTVDENRYRSLRVAMLDARNYVVIGDPAVRLRPPLPGATAPTRSAIDPGSIEAGRLALATVAHPEPAAKPADAVILGNSVLSTSGQSALPEMTIDQLAGLLTESAAAGFSAPERERLTKAYLSMRTVPETVKPHRE